MSEERNWVVTWRLKRTPAKKRTARPTTRARAIKQFIGLRQLGYSAELGTLGSGPLPMLFIMATHRRPRWGFVDGQHVVQGYHPDYVDKSVSELEERLCDCGQNETCEKCVPDGRNFAGDPYM